MARSSRQIVFKHPLSDGVKRGVILRKTDDDELLVEMRHFKDASGKWKKIARPQTLTIREKNIVTDDDDLSELNVSDKSILDEIEDDEIAVPDEADSGPEDSDEEDEPVDFDVVAEGPKKKSYPKRKMRKELAGASETHGNGLLLVGGLIVGAILLLGGGTVAVAKYLEIQRAATEKERIAFLKPYFEKAAKKWGVPLSWLFAFAKHESNLDPLAVAGKGTADERRGGSWGAIQMSLQTAQDLGYSGPILSLDDVEGTRYTGQVPPGSILDPAVNADLAAHLLSQLSKRFSGQLRDVAAGYNSGKPYDKAPESTRLKYVPHLLEMWQQFADMDGPAEESSPEEDVS